MARLHAMTTTDDIPRVEASTLGVFEAMRKRRMHRAFSPDPVDEGSLERLVYAAGRAPVARADIRHLVVVTDPRLVRTIRQVCPGFVNNAPALIAICSDLEKVDEHVGRGRLVARMDAGAAAAYLTLAAPVLGLGVCVVTSWTERAVQEILRLPRHVRPEILVAVGHPVPRPPRAVRKFEPSVHRDRFGTPWRPSS
jgi:nitroreductase